MATNPKFPDDREFKRRHLEEAPHLQVKKRPFPWPVIILVAAAAILIVLFVALPRLPKERPAPAAAQVPPQPTGSQIQFSHFQLTGAPVGSAYYLDGMLFNNGDREITGVQVQVNFEGSNGQTVGTQTQPVEEVATSSGADTKSLVQRPIKPNESRRVRIYLEHPPANWNHQLPQLTVTAVTATRP